MLLSLCLVLVLVDWFYN